MFVLYIYVGDDDPAAVDGINGTIITYGQLMKLTHGNAGTFGQGPSMMVEIYMENIRDLLDLSKDNIQIKESKEGMVLNGVTERGIANRTVEETQTNMSSRRSHCIYLFTVQQESKNDNKLKTGKLILVHLAGSEKAEKTGAEGNVLEEANANNKSLLALENVINALTCGTPGKANLIPNRDSKLTQILQDALGGNSCAALLCCCSPSTSNASEILSTLRFGMRFLAVVGMVPFFDLIFIEFPELFTLLDFGSQ
ncbi:hypothetical protein ACLB2K_061161 [Fragaria x ananassa]